MTARGVNKILRSFKLIDYERFLNAVKLIYILLTFKKWLLSFV